MTALLTRRSVRKYTGEPVKPEDLTSILECGRLAPSATNQQAWHFVAVTDKALLEKIAALMPYGKHIAQSGATIAVFTAKDCFGPHEDAPAATTNMLLAAHALGYGACWIGCYDTPTYPDVAALLNAPDDWTMMTLFSVGVIDGPIPTPKKKAFEDVISYNGF
jgi:nitroreductase